MPTAGDSGARRRQLRAACCGSTGRGRRLREIVAAQDCGLTAGAEPVRFVTTAEGRIAAGETEALVPAQAEQPGSTGNAAAGSITVLVTAVGSVDGVENPEGFSGGQDAETDDELRSRLLESYHAVSNGSNAAYYRRLALAQDGVASVQVIQRPRGSGSVDLVIAGGGRGSFGGHRPGAGRTGGPAAGTGCGCPGHCRRGKPLPGDAGALRRGELRL